MRVVVLVIALCATAYADPAATAREYYLAGQAAYKAGDFAAAALAFEQASQALPDPATTFSMAQAYRQLFATTHDSAYGARALELYQSYLRDLPRGGRSEDAREFVANLDTLLELQKYRGPVTAKSIAPKTQLMVWSSVNGAQASIDGAAISPLPLVLDTTAGEHAVEISAPGHDPAHLKISAVDGRLVPVEGRLTPKAATLHFDVGSNVRILVDEVDVANTPSGISVPAGRHRVWLGMRGRDPIQREIEVAPGGSENVNVAFVESVRRRRARWLLVGGAVLGASALGALAYSTVEGTHADNLLDKRETRAWTPSESDDYANSRDAALSWRIAAITLGVGAAAVAGIGTYFYYSDTPDAPHRRALVGVTGSF